VAIMSLPPRQVRRAGHAATSLLKDPEK